MTCAIAVLRDERLLGLVLDARAGYVRVTAQVRLHANLCDLAKSTLT